MGTNCKSNKDGEYFSPKLHNHLIIFTNFTRMITANVQQFFFSVVVHVHLMVATNHRPTY